MRMGAVMELVVVVLVTAVSCAAPQRGPVGWDPTPVEGQDREVRREELLGRASWYGERHHGRTTASGEPFDMNALTAAHRTLPFGTMVRVTRTDTRQSVVVRINDRGPFTEGRVIDLSRAAATEIDMIRAGVVDVQLQVLRWGGR